MIIESIAGKGSFKLRDGGVLITEMIYENWYSHKVSDKHKGNFIEIRPTRFWQSKVSIFRNREEVGEMQFNWRGRYK